jgi:hypothetical protein
MSARVTRAASDNHSAQFPRHCFQRFGKRQYACIAFALFQTDKPDFAHEAGLIDRQYPDIEPTASLGVCERYQRHADARLHCPGNRVQFVEFEASCDFSPRGELTWRRLGTGGGRPRLRGVLEGVGVKIVHGVVERTDCGRIAQQAHRGDATWLRRRKSRPTPRLIV